MRFLERRHILAAQQQLIERYGGEGGLRDEAALDGALGAPESTFGGELLHATVPEVAAAYLFHLCQNHPFMDGNKRVALAAAVLFTILNGWVFDLSEEEAEWLTMGVAKGELGKRELTRVFLERLRPE